MDSHFHPLESTAHAPLATTHRFNLTCYNIPTVDGSLHAVGDDPIEDLCSEHIVPVRRPSKAADGTISVLSPTQATWMVVGSAACVCDTCMSRHIAARSANRHIHTSGPWSGSISQQVVAGGLRERAAGGQPRPGPSCSRGAGESGESTHHAAAGR